MEKTIVGPGTGSIDSSVIEEVPSAHAVATRHHDHIRLQISGTAWSSGALETQTRKIFEFFERVVGEFDADMRSITRTRTHIAEPHLTASNRRTVHEVRAEFFERPHYPASTFVEVSGLAHEDALVEIEAEALVPDSDWEIDTRMDE